MLEFFRRYQRSLFIVITVVIIASFSFFGTFQTFSSREQEDKVAFTALDGSKIRKSELSDMIVFLTSDSHDFLFSPSGAGNALNDGVIPTDFLESGLAEVIAAPFLPEIGEEEQARLEREKRYSPYAHPKAPFLTAEQIWAYYAPDIKSNFDRLRSYESARSNDAFSTRVNLFVAERRFPAAYLKQFLRYQESSHKWLAQDPNLAYQNLALFGYSNVQDWFGKNFVDLVAQFIINGAKVAEQKGYKVTKEEALGSLFRNAETAFRESRSQGLITATNAGDFFQEQLRRMGMDQSRAVKVWTQILLFRSLFFENADSVLVDTTAYAPFYHHLNEYVDIDYYQLPSEFRFASMKDLEQFVLYLNAVQAPESNQKKQNLLALPEQFLTPSEVKKVYPELVERKVILRWSALNKDQLQTKIGVKNTWEWQVQDKNWQKLKERYPELAGHKDETLEERLAILEKLDPARRANVDSSSRQEIIEENPEWIKKALVDAPSQEEEVSLREQGGKMPFDGIKDQLALISLIDSAPLNEWSDALSTYSQDGVHVYRIQVLDRSKPETILTFADAKKDGTIDKMLDKTLESSYSRLRTKEPALFLKEDGEWKPYKEVKENVANLYFETLFAKLDHDIEILKEKMPHFIDWSDRQKSRLSVTLLPFVDQARSTLESHPEKASAWIQEMPSESEEESKTPASKSAGPEQFKLEKSRERLVRRDPTFVADPALAFTLHSGVISPLTVYQQSGPSFFTVVEKGFLPSTEQVRAKVLEERDLLGREALVELGRLLLADMRKKDAIILEISQSQTESQTQSKVDQSQAEEQTQVQTQGQEQAQAPQDALKPSEEQ